MCNGVASGKGCGKEDSYTIVIGSIFCPYLRAAVILWTSCMGEQGNDEIIFWAVSIRPASEEFVSLTENGN
jgi:hypothetical protein